MRAGNVTPAIWSGGHWQDEGPGDGELGTQSDHTLRDTRYKI